MKEMILAGVVLVMLAGAVQAVTNVAPTVVVNSAAMRPGTTYMDIHFRVNDPDDATVKVRALAFIDGSRSFANVVRMATFVEGTESLVGDNVPVNTDHTLVWDVGSDWDIDLGQVKIEIMARDERGLLKFDWVTIPKPGTGETITISLNAPTDAEVRDALFWLFADGDDGLVLEGETLMAKPDGGMFFTDAVILAAGLNVRNSEAALFLIKNMNLKPDFGRWIDFANSARAGLIGPQDLRPLNQPYEAPSVEPGPMTLVEGGTLPSIGNGVLNVSDFYIGKYEVTKGAWDVVRSWAIANGYSINVGTGATTNHPVASVNWHDVVKWCNANSEMEGLTPAYEAGGEIYRSGNSNDLTVVSTANGYRLPTDAEWEYAARGGNYSQGYIYSGGNDPNTVGWNSGNSLGRSWPIGLKMFNELGLHDMSGNIGEWCFDWHPSTVGSGRVVRGGGWYDPTNTSRARSRSTFALASGWGNIGFRLARPAGD